ncbi:MAG TPA: SidA/IucD/PvdA family monooxygenase [Jatrophihabitans sp.]|nr:SidA/IucD/PvdA family monooxygenase [Jatrophihabitans sp.]
MPVSPDPHDKIAAAMRGADAAAAGSGGHVNCLGVGVGPANLSLACLLTTRPGLTGLFLERRPSFGWHDGQQLADAALQVSMLKDLVSLADPTSPYSFLNYLHDAGRIYHYLNAQFDAVPRMEFRNYLAWAAARNPHVVFDEEVQSIDFDDTARVFRIGTSRRELTADHVSVGVGNQPWVPPLAQPYLSDPRIFHISQFTSAATDVAGLRVTVVGGGQSGAEAFLDLINRQDAQLPRRVSWISRRANFFPIDDSPFTNDYYMPDHSDYFASLPNAVRQTFNTQHLLTSDGISEATLRAIYQRIYSHHYIQGRPDLVALYPNRNLIGLQLDPATGYELSLTHGHHPDLLENLDTDVIVFATGFRPNPMAFLAPLTDRIAMEDGEFLIDQHYAACWDGPGDRHLFLQNATRNQRGLADPNLSLLAWRSQRILDRLTNTASRPQQPSFIEWTTKPVALTHAPGGSDDY